MFNQVFEANDLLAVGVLIILEGLLSIDNALVLGLLAKRVRPDQQSRVLTYGLVGAFFIRLVAIGFAQYLLGWQVVKLLGGGYLIYVAGNFFFNEWFTKGDERVSIDQAGEPTLVETATGAALSQSRIDEEIESRTVLPLPERDEPLENGTSSGIGTKTVKDSASKVLYASFWKTVVVVELTDLAFAIDSILAGIALVGPPPAEHTGIHPKLWVVVLGGMLGVAMMRVAAMIFIKLLEKFPRFELSAYLLIVVIGSKLCLDWIFNSADHPHRLDFHSPTHPAFIAFWSLMAVSFLIGFIKPKSPEAIAS